MSSKTIFMAAAVLGASLLTLQPARAADEELGGKAVPGVCMLSRQAVITNAKVGKAADARLKQLAGQARSELQKERAPLDKDIQDYRAKAASMSAAERKQKEEALKQRMEKFQARAQELSQRIQLTRAKVMNRIGQDVQPVLAAAYKRKGCGLLIDRDSVLGGNMDNDLTPDVVAGVDKKVSTISFNLEPLPKSNGKR
jgi:Skp family chaperone for outer membrane proteins